MEEYRRACLIAAEFSRRHPRVTIAVGLRAGGDFLVAVAVMGETRPRSVFDAPRASSREELFERFSDAAEVGSPEDEWDW